MAHNRILIAYFNAGHGRVLGSEKGEQLLHNLTEATWLLLPKNVNLALPPLRGVLLRPAALALLTMRALLFLIKVMAKNLKLHSWIGMQACA